MALEMGRKWWVRIARSNGQVEEMRCFDVNEALEGVRDLTNGKDTWFLNTRTGEWHRISAKGIRSIEIRESR